MTIEEVKEIYQIPDSILKLYDDCEMRDKKEIQGKQYDNTDIQQLGIILTLQDIGLESQEIKQYMNLLMQGNHTMQERVRMINQRRSDVLKEIHIREKQIERMDYLRYTMNKAK